MIKREEEYKEALNILFKAKPIDKIMVKACEELNELSTALLKRVNKPKKISDYDIMEEIADCKMHLQLLEMLLPDVEDKVINEKIEKFLASNTLKKYREIYNNFTIKQINE